jgi:hypothetical protein
MTERRFGTPAPEPTSAAPPFRPPLGMPGQRDGRPAGMLPQPRQGRHGDEQRDPSPEDLVELARVQHDGNGKKN